MAPCELAPFEIDDVRPQKNQKDKFLPIFLFIYLTLLTAGFVYLAYRVLTLEKELAALREGLCSLRCPEKHQTGEALTESAEGSTMNPDIEEKLHSLNMTAPSAGTWLIALEEEIRQIHLKNSELNLRINNVTLWAGGDVRSGERGPPGAPGARGEKGDTGLPGQKGEEGSSGKVGLSGPIGPSGLPGKDGSKGEAGEPGQAGAKGDVGNPGPKGPEGMKGETGSPGIPGEKGQKGDTGLGEDEGTGGRMGPPGPAGPPGRDGQKGAAGHPGQDGQKGDSGTPGNPGEQGATGPKGSKGEAGVTGAPGIPGAKGEKGEAASDFVRIVGGKRGRVEIKRNGEWGTICDDNWDSNDGKVICRMLGYSRFVTAFTANAGTGKILLDDVQCTGNENSILECPKSAWETHNCSHSEDAGVECA